MIEGGSGGNGSCAVTGCAPAPQGIWYLDHLQVFAWLMILAGLIIAVLALVVWLQARRRELERRHSRYEFDTDGHWRRVPPTGGKNDRG